MLYINGCYILDRYTYRICREYIENKNIELINKVELINTAL